MLRPIFGKTVDIGKEVKLNTSWAAKAECLVRQNLAYFEHMGFARFS